jgi:hypothetical protein
VSVSHIRFARYDVTCLLMCPPFGLGPAPWDTCRIKRQMHNLSVDYIFSSLAELMDGSSHLGLFRCLTLIVRVSTQHDSQTFTKKF